MGLNIIVIGIICPIEELKRRETVRGNRRIGVAESQILQVHQGIVYDFEVDTSKDTSKNTAKKIAAVVRAVS